MRMIPELAFSTATSDDVFELANLFTAAAIRKEELEGQPLWPNPCPQSYANQLVSQKDVYVAKIAGSIAATMAIALEDPRYWGDQSDCAIYVHRLAVHPAHTGHGIGSRMLNYANFVASGHDREFVRLDCSHHLTSYYESQGFVVQGVFTSLRTGYVGHQYQRLVSA